MCFEFMGEETRRLREHRLREGAERPSTTPGAIVWARSSVNKRCPSHTPQLHSTNLPISPTGQRTENKHGLLDGQYSSRVAQMKWPSVVHQPYCEMLRKHEYAMEADSGLSSPHATRRARPSSHQIIIINHWMRNLTSVRQRRVSRKPTCR